MLVTAGQYSGFLLPACASSSQTNRAAPHTFCRVSTSGSMITTSGAAGSFLIRPMLLQHFGPAA